MRSVVVTVPRHFFLNLTPAGLAECSRTVQVAITQQSGAAVYGGPDPSRPEMGHVSVAHNDSSKDS
jgi:hypothetical protein